MPPGLKESSKRNKVNWNNPKEHLKNSSNDNTGNELLSAEERIRNHFDPVSKPDKAPKLPDRISSLNGEMLSELQLIYAAWREYTEDLISAALPEFTRLKEKYEYEYDVSLLQQEDGMKVKEKEAHARIDVRKTYLSLQEADLYYQMLSRQLERYNNCLTVISREITRRTQDA